MGGATDLSCPSGGPNSGLLLASTANSGRLVTPDQLFGTGGSSAFIPWTGTNRMTLHSREGFDSVLQGTAVGEPVPDWS
jgi:hypothetical protein